MWCDVSVRSVALRIVVGALAGRRGVRKAEFTAAVDVLLPLLLVLLDVAGVPRRQLQRLLRLDAGLQLTSPLELGVELRTEQQREVGDPQPQEKHDRAGEEP